MEEKTKKELRKERRKERKEKRKQVWSENKDMLVQVGIACLGFVGTCIGIAGIVIDHKMTRQDQDRNNGLFYDPDYDVYWDLGGPLTNEENAELISLERQGMTRQAALREMGKL